MPDEDDSVLIWYRRGRYAIGREGYRPFVSLPEDKAQRALSGTTTAERLSFGILLTSGLVIGAQALGALIPIAVDAVLFILELSLVTLASSVIAQTVIDRETTTTTRPTGVEVQGQSPERSNDTEHPAIAVLAQVRDSRLYVNIENFRRRAIIVRLKEAWSDSGNLDIQGMEDEEASAISHTSTDSIPKFEIAYDVSSLINKKEFNDILHVVFALGSDYNGDGKSEQEISLSIPVTVQAEGQIESEQVTETVSFERLTD